MLDDRVMASHIFPLGVSYTNFSDPKTNLSGMSCLVRCLTAWLQRVWEASPRNIPLKIRKRLLMAREQGWHTFRAEWLSTMKCVGLSRSKKRLDPEILVDKAQGRVRSSRVRRCFFLTWPDFWQSNDPWPSEGNKFNWGFDWQNFVVGLVCVEALQWNIGVRHSFFWLVGVSNCQLPATLWLGCWFALVPQHVTLV